MNYRTHERILFALLEVIAEGKSNSKRVFQRNTKYSVTCRMHANDHTVGRALDELQDNGLIITTKDNDQLRVYELTEKGEQCRMLAKRQKELLDW